LDYLKIVNKSKEKYLVIIPFNQVTGYFITGFELMRPVAPTLYKQLTLKVSLKRDFEDIELLELLPNTTQLSFEFAVPALRMTYVQFTERVNKDSVCESKLVIMKLIASKHLK